MRELLALLLLVTAVNCQNSIDTSLPIVRTVNTLQQNDYFSYTMVLHQTQANPATRQDSLDSTRIIVSAPRHNVPGGTSQQPGAVWDCPVTMGDCSPLRGDGISAADGRLFDDSGSVPATENRDDQFLGASMASNGDHFIVCAHRYQVQNPTVGEDNFLLRGRCYYSDRDLSGFSELSPCENYGSTSNRGTAVCTAGVSSVVTSDGAQGVFGVGAPGAYLWRGSMSRFEAGTGEFAFTRSAGQDAFGLLGYTMVTGRFSSPTRLDYAVSNPRYTQSSYLGRVAIITNSQALTITNLPLNGQQMGEYYGFSLLAADMSGEDSYDELIVAAPMYRANGNQPETGRIYVYRNNQGALTLVRTIVGRDSFSRFGYAMANLGDISGDGFDDIAVSAPFGSGPGTVFIYYSSATTTIMPNPSQEITGSMVNANLMTPNMAITGFGTTLASGVDVDGNSYNDLAVGSFISQEVYLLRTRPLASVQLSVTSDMLIVDLGSPTCNLRGTQYACFTVTACIEYSGSGLNNMLDLTVTLFAERETIQNNLEQRIFFDNGISGQFPAMIAETRQANLGAETCVSQIAYVQNGITDVFNGFIIEAVVTPPVFSPPQTDGNEANPTDLSDFPVVSTTGVSSIQVETLKECEGQICTPDLDVMINDLTFVPVSTSSATLTQLTVGAVSELNTQLIIRNNADDAFQSTLTIRYLTNQLQVTRVYNNTASGGQLSLSCSETKQDAFTVHSCNIGNPLNSNTGLTVNVLFMPRPELIGNEGSLSVQYTVDSVNEEDPSTEANNMRTQMIDVNAAAEVFIDNPGLVFPESVSYSNIAPPNTIENVTQLGPSVRTTFVVRNRGPSSVPNVELVIMWPYDGRTAGINTFIYPSAIRSTSGASVMCETENINRLQFALPEEDGIGGEGTGIGTEGKRRRRRSIANLGRRVRRQAVMTPGDEEMANTDVTEDVELFCENADGDDLICVPLRCNILGLRGGDSAQVEVTSYVDERSFFESNDRYRFRPTAAVRIVDADYILTPPTQMGASADIVVIPAGDLNPDDIVPPFPWYAVVFPLIAVILIIAGIIVGLYFCGFFRRAKHEEIKAKREELQNLADNGVTAAEAGGDGTNL